MKAFVLMLLAAATTLAADVTGTWYFAVELSVGSGAPTFVLKQEGSKLTGTYSGTLGEAPVTGTVKGDKIEFSFQAETAGEKFRAVYSGTIKDSKNMEGKADYGEFGDGTWTARKKE